MDILVRILIFVGSLGVIFTLGQPVYRNWRYALAKSINNYDRRVWVIRAFWMSVYALILGYGGAIFFIV